MQMVVVAHNIRSAHNVGAILRTADGFGVQAVWLTGYTPYPTQLKDARLPHLRTKITNQIHKTALGAEITVPTQHKEDGKAALQLLRDEGYCVVALEQATNSVPLPAFRYAGERLALLLGEEVAGIEPALLNLCDAIIEIPMKGHKESFNVSVATGIALYELSKLSN